MPAPAKTFTAIPDDKIDADSPVTEELMTWLRDNGEHLRDWLGKDFAAEENHDHDGINSAPIDPLTHSPFPFLMAAPSGWFGTSSTAFVSMFSRPFWMPRGKSKVAVRAYMRRDSATGTADPVGRLRLVGPAGTDNGDEITHTGGLTPGLHELSVSVSAGNRGQYCTLHLELRRSAISTNGVEVSKDGGTVANDQSLAGHFE